MVRQIDAIISLAALRPLAPLALPEGTRVRLRLEEVATPGPAPCAAMVHTPKLVHPGDAVDFVMGIREAGDTWMQHERHKRCNAL